VLIGKVERKPTENVSARSDVCEFNYTGTAARNEASVIDVGRRASVDVGEFLVPPLGKD
jgi:hypothetical protein